MSDFSEFEYANLSNLSFIEQLYRAYLTNPENVDASWRYFFEGMRLGRDLSGMPSLPRQSSDQEGLRVKLLIEGFRYCGHLAAHCNPLIDEVLIQNIPQLSLETYGFGKEDLNKEVDSWGVVASNKTSLGGLIEALKKIYCHHIGIEIAHLNAEMQAFIIKQLEPGFSKQFTQDERYKILEDLNRSEIFETFIHRQYPGQKRFSLEGGESVIPLINEIFDASAKLGVQEGVLGMAHRGRLNVLANIMQKTYQEIFYEFSPNYLPNLPEGGGDVKYHKGFKSKITTKSGLPLQVELSENASHLESVNMIVEGIAKGKQVIFYEGKKESVLPILIHGDASIAGQGSVYETLQLYKLEGYETGGTIHIIINNQVGFTATPKEGRSTLYCTDIAKAFACPVFHVNGDDPESCVHIGRIASGLRNHFGCDVFIEIVCYRKYGHSEGDEPFFTQPKLYEIIQKKKSVRDLYLEDLLANQELSQEEAQKLEQMFLDKLEEARQASHQRVHTKEQLQSSKPVEKATAVHGEKLIQLASKFCAIPQDCSAHPKVRKLFQDRLTAVTNQAEIDWGLAEYLAYASLLEEEYAIRLSGEDSRRGTFAHRHAAIIDQMNGSNYIPLEHLKQGQGLFTVYNSPLSEYAVLGFEFGYAQIMQKGLVIWEAQFGDFANGAQIIIDQYLVAAKEKWNINNPLVLFLPHGYEGQGPEHSSARLERFLQLTANRNIKIVVPTHPSQVFHLLRGHAINGHRFPVVVMTPKALLRYPLSLSPFKEFMEGKFHEVLDDPSQYIQAERILLCSGKVYYDLVEERKKRSANIAIIRIEQLYPLPAELLKTTLERYQKAKEFFWVQEEHRNMGAYEHLCFHLREILPVNTKLCYVGRPRSASPAVGSFALHQTELKHLLEKAFSKA